jgi:hypothetical protein
MSMDESTAKQIADHARPAHDVPASYALHSAQRRIIEITDGDSKVEAPVRDVHVRDVRVWLIRFQAGAAWAELAVDEATSSVVRVQRSRSR